MTTLATMVSKAQKVNDDKEIQKAVENLRLAMISGNRDQLAKVASGDLSYGHSGGHVENKEEFIEKIASGKSQFTSILLSEQTIKISGEVATVRHNLKAETNNDGVPGTVNLHVLSVWRRKQGEWKMLARQAVKLTH